MSEIDYEYEPDSQWLKIGSVCGKGNGHFQFIGDDEWGMCGSRYTADVYIVPRKGYGPHPDYEAIRANVGEMEKGLQRLRWKEFDDPA
mgnify:FL=1